MTEDEQHQLYLQMKDLPDFDCFPLPQHWYKKYNIEQPGVINPKEFMESGYAIKCQFAKKDLPTIVKGPLLDENGEIRHVPFLPIEEIKVTTTTRPFRMENGEFPVVLPSLLDIPEIPEPEIKEQKETEAVPHHS